MFHHKFFLFCIFLFFINLSRARPNKKCEHHEVMASDGKTCYPCPESGYCNGDKSVICENDKVFIKNNKGGKCVNKINSSSSDSSFEDMYEFIADTGSSSEEDISGLEFNAGVA